MPTHTSILPLSRPCSLSPCCAAGLPPAVRMRIQHPLLLRSRPALSRLKQSAQATTRPPRPAHRPAARRRRSTRGRAVPRTPIPPRSARRAKPPPNRRSGVTPTAGASGSQEIGGTAGRQDDEGGHRHHRGHHQRPGFGIPVGFGHEPHRRLHCCAGRQPDRRRRLEPAPSHADLPSHAAGIGGTRRRFGSIAGAAQGTAEGERSLRDARPPRERERPNPQPGERT